MTPWELINNLYLKSKGPLMLDTGICITLNKWLGFDRSVLKLVKPLIHYTFYIEPLHYYYLLFFSIPQRYKVPFLYRPTKEKVMKPSLLLNKVQYILGWTDKEMDHSKEILEHVLKDENYWKKELAVK